MSKYVRKADRIRQIVKWLAVAFPLPWAVDLKLVSTVKIGPDRTGKVTEGKYLGAALVWSEELAEIQLRASMTRDFMLDTLFHEWAHLRREVGHASCGGCGETGCVEGHDDEFYLEYGRISRGYDSNGGKKASMLL